MKRAARLLFVFFLLAAQVFGQCNNPPCEEPANSMPGSFTGAYTEAATWVTPPATSTTLSPSLPYADSSQLIIAFINLATTDGLGTNPTCTAPDGTWTLIQDNGASGLGRYTAAWWKAGTGSTATVNWSFNAPCRGQVVLAVASDCNVSSPTEATPNFHQDGSGSTSHPNTGVTTANNNEIIVGLWAAADTGVQFYETSDFPNTVINIAGGHSFERAMLVGYILQPASGASGTKTVSSDLSLTAHSITFALKATPNPSLPLMTFPNGGEALTSGAVVTVTSTASTSPTAAQSSLQYDFDYSLDAGGTWTNIGFSSAGVTSKSWTVPGTLTNVALCRVRCKDPAGPLFSGYDQSNAYFRIIAEVAPPAPTITAPVGGSVNDKAVPVTVSWVHGGGASNPQTKYTIQWSHDNFASHTVTVGPITSSAQSTTIDFSGEASGATISLKVKTTGATLDSPYSSVRQFIVASLPATPNITAPVAASPPATALPTVTFTESDSFVSRRFRVIQSGTLVYDTNEISSNSLSFVSPYTFQNGVTVTIYLSVKSALGLWSAEDSETVTPSFTVPATPTLTLTSASPLILAQITNSDSPSYNELWRWQEIMMPATLGPTSGSSATGTGVAGDTAWTNPLNVLANDANYASVVPTVASKLLKVTGFEFSFGSRDVITGIKLSILRKKTGSTSVKDQTVRLAKSGSGVGNDYQDLVTEWPTTFTLKEYGGPGDLWGTTWSPSDMSNIGAWLSIISLGGEADVNWVYLTVYANILTSGGIETAIRVATGLPKNVSFQDYNVVSGRTYGYYALAYNSNGSAASSSAYSSLVLDSLVVHAVSKTSVAGTNQGNPAILVNPQPTSADQNKLQNAVKLLGRSRPLVVGGTAQQGKMTQTALISRADSALLANLLAIQALARSNQEVIVCGRDQSGNRVLGKLTVCQVMETRDGYNVAIEITGAAYIEAA